jgi:hypothetical protein
MSSEFKEKCKVKRESRWNMLSGMEWSGKCIKKSLRIKILGWVTM